MHRKKTITVTEEHKKILEEFIDKTIALKKKEYHSNLEPFESYAAKLRADMYNHFLDFYVSFMSGYEILKNETTKK